MHSDFLFVRVRDIRLARPFRPFTSIKKLSALVQLALSLLAQTSLSLALALTVTLTLNTCMQPDVVRYLQQQQQCTL